MPWTIDDRFKTAANKAVVDFILRNPVLSAHSDIAEVLTRSAEGLADSSSYCPNLQSYAYMLLHTRAGRIFGIAFGQSALAYRLPKERIPEAVADGGSVYSDIGDDWVVMDPWGTHRTNVSRWCKAAHDHAVKAGGHV